MSAMKNPPHPGETVRIECIEASGLTVTEAARHLRCSRPTLSRVLNGRAAISPEMALAFEGRDGALRTSGYAARPPTTWHRHAAGPMPPS